MCHLLIKHSIQLIYKEYTNHTRIIDESGVSSCNWIFFTINFLICVLFIEANNQATIIYIHFHPKKGKQINVAVAASAAASAMAMTHRCAHLFQPMASFQSIQFVSSVFYVNVWKWVNHKHTLTLLVQRNFERWNEKKWKKILPSMIECVYVPKKLNTYQIVSDFFLLLLNTAPW